MSQGQGSNPFDAVLQQVRAGRKEQAEAGLRRLVKRPELAEHGTQLLGMLLIEMGRYVQAEFELDRAVKQWPRNVNLMMTLHIAQLRQGKAALAMETAERALALAPDSFGVMMAIASLHQHQFKLVESEKWFRKARAANPQAVPVVTGLAAVLSASLRGEETVELLRGAIASGLDGMELRRLLAFRLQYVSGVSARELFEAHRVSGPMVAAEVLGNPATITVDANPDRVLTVGLLSPDFRQHACAHFVEPLLEARDRSRWRVVAYSNVTQGDATTARLKRLCDAWRETATVSDEALAQQIAADKVDIAIDLAGHTGGSRVSALVLRPAPVTVTFLGYPNTTGMPGIDYRIVDSVTDPEGSEEFATEKLVRLDPCFLCYRPSLESPEVRPLPMERVGHVTFGSFNILDKISRGTLDAWAEILKRMTGSKMLIKSRSAAAESEIVQRIHAEFASRGIEASRVEVVGSTAGIREHLELYGRVDIALDTFPYNGTTTTCEAMWMGVPVVAMRGEIHASRVGVSLLSAVGLRELVSDDPEGYVALACKLASDVGALKELRSGLRERVAASPLRDERGYAAKFEELLRGLWRTSCASRAGRPNR